MVLAFSWVGSLYIFQWSPHELLVGVLVAIFKIFPLILGMSSSQLTNSYFSEGWPNHQPGYLQNPSITWWLIPRIVSGLVHPSYKWTLPPLIPLTKPGLFHPPTRWTWDEPPSSWYIVLPSEESHNGFFPDKTPRSSTRGVEPFWKRKSQACGLLGIRKHTYIYIYVYYDIYI